MATNLIKILVLCTGNSCRSQIAHGYLEHLLKNKAVIYSAGTEIHGVNPLTVDIMQEDNIDISTYTSNHISEYLHLSFDFVITVCDLAKDTCPVFSGNGKIIHESFQDPAKKSGTYEDRLQSFRHVRNQIKQFCRDFYETHLNL